MDQQYLNQFSGTARLVGKKVFDQFITSHVTIVGVGGVGSWSAESLVRSGFGTITLIDLDDVCLTNTNRQLHALVETVGQMKVQALKKRLLQINSHAHIHAIEDFLGEQNIGQIIPKNSIVIDAIDSLGNKAILAKYCVDNAIDLVTCGGAAGKQDPTLIKATDLGLSEQDNLLRRLKKKLRTQHDFPRTGSMNIRAVYSTERAMYPTADGGLCFKKDLDDKGQAKMDCAEGMGSASFLTGAFGLAAAHQVIKLIEEKL
jgi:tRNA A37 threonylcarbamoyladenosine dehydratase